MAGELGGGMSCDGDDAAGDACACNRAFRDMPMFFPGPGLSFAEVELVRSAPKERSIVPETHKQFVSEIAGNQVVVRDCLCFYSACLHSLRRLQPRAISQRDSREKQVV